MTQKDKELLLKDLCARLPYGVKFACNKNVYTATGLDLIVTDEGDWEYAVTAKGIAPIEIDFIKPYLLPLSSMTVEQIKEFNSITQKCNTYIGKSILLADFCNKHHIDWRGLIEKELVIDATDKNIY